MTTRRLWCVFVLCFAGLATAACSTGTEQQNNSPTLESVEGTWLIKHDGFGCPSLDGSLLENTLIVLHQDGSTVTADQVDQFGNRYVLEGTYDNGLTGTLTVTLANGRVVVVGIDTFVALPPEKTQEQLDGTLAMQSDSDNECEIGKQIGVWFLPSSDPDDVLPECGPVDIVFIMDTSGSMDDEAQALCDQLEGVLQELEDLGLEDVRVRLWGINEDADAEEHQQSGDFACLDNNVRDVFGNPIVPGTEDRRIFKPERSGFEGDEDWGPAISIVAHFASQEGGDGFKWRDGVVKIIVPISDEGPSQGDSDDDDDPAFPDSDDVELIAIAIENANANDVIVCPIVGSGAEPLTAELALEVAAGTGGIAVRSTGGDLDLGKILFDIIFIACGGIPEVPESPAPFEGDTMLVVADRGGDIYSVDPQSGALSFLVPAEEGDSEPLSATSSMVYNESAEQLWAGLGGQSGCDGCIYSIDGSGLAEFLSFSETGDGQPGLTYRRSDGVIFGTAGEDDDLWVFDNVTAQPADYTDDISKSAHEKGNALAFVGPVMYWAGEDHLYVVNQFTGRGTDLGELTFADSILTDTFAIVSMTAPPGSTMLYAILKDRAEQPRTTYVCTIDPATRVITVLQETVDLLVDGIAWVPANYFTPVPD